MARSPKKVWDNRSSVSAFQAHISLLIALAAVSVTAAAWTIRLEYLTQLSERRLDDQTTLFQSPGEVRSIAIDTPAAPTARLVAANALFLARQASRTPPGPARNAMLADARDGLMTATEGRPHWGERWVIVAFTASLQSPPAPDVERQALVSAYAEAPFLEKSGYWRVERALVYWEVLPPSTRYRMIDEAAWLLRRGDVQNRAPLFNLVRSSPAYRAVFLRWHELGPA